MSDTLTLKVERFDLAHVSAMLRDELEEALANVNSVFDRPDDFDGDKLKACVTVKLRLTFDPGQNSTSLSAGVETKLPARKVKLRHLMRDAKGFLVEPEAEQLALYTHRKPAQGE